MTNALAPLSILLSFGMGVLALDQAPTALFATKADSEPPATPADSSDSLGLGEQITIASRPHGSRFFTLEANVNGVPTTFLVDTAATTTVLRKSDAIEAALALGGATLLQTANGKVSVVRTSIETMTIGGIVLSNVQAVVADDALPHSLIGLDALDKLGTIVIHDSSMTVLLSGNSLAD